MAESKGFSTLDGLTQMFSPVDLAGTQGITLGGPLDKIGDNTNPYKLLLGLLENSGRGVYSIDALEAEIQKIKSKGKDGSDKVDLSKYLTIWTTKKVIDIGDNTSKDKISINAKGAPENLKSLVEVVGKDFKMPEGYDVSVILIRSPFLNPATCNTKKAEIFLNSMPSVVLSQMVPYMQVEFQFQRDRNPQLQTAGLLKFLMGAADTSKFTDGNKAMNAAHVRPLGKDGELDFAGMEMFTSPQTLVNPQPNKNVGRAGERYTEVLDPFRPFASLQHVTISVSPAGAGFFTYKKANLSLKLHDRSRLAEISDLLRPRIYTGVTIWMTYGWRAPGRGAQNPYFKYVNDNLMVREAYHIVNSSFSFDNVGQVTINLELFTKGVAELREMKISDNNEDMAFRTGKVKRLIEDISRYRQQLKLDPPESFNKEIRVFQILDAAETGTFPDMKANEVQSKIDSLEKSLSKTAGPDKDALQGLIKSMKELYKADTRDKTKFVLKEEYDTRVSSTVNKMFAEVRTGPDPFLPQEGKGKGDDITKLIKAAKKPPATKVDKSLSSVVSFGKLFSVFALRAIASIPQTVHESQIFFYNLNESCGPISNHSIAEFPIDMNQFVDQFNDLVKQRGGEKITLEDFLRLCINAQFLDNRAIGYGLHQFYKPYAKGQEAALKDGKNVEQDFENQLAAYGRQFGPFKKPVVEMHIECSHERVSEAGETDVLQALAYSAADSATFDYKDITEKSTKRIMRIHVYDKQTNAYAAASQFFKSPHETALLAPASTDYAKSLSSAQLNIDPATSDLMTFQQDVKNNRVKIIEFKNSQAAKDLVAQMMPVIRFGANGTTITAANLTSKADQLLSAVQMMRTQTVKNTASPNGAGVAGIPLRVIPAQLSMTSFGMPLAMAAQKYFIDFQTGTTLDNLYILTNYVHNFSPGKFETVWTFGFADGYGIFEGAQNIVKAATGVDPNIPKAPG
jgi:hypothetical protein